MDLNQSVAQKQQQTLKLSPKMVQSLSLLAMPVFDLRESILAEVEKNPALEIVRDGANANEVPTPVPKLRGLYEESGMHKAGMHSRAAQASDDFLRFLENSPAHSETLQEHLLTQLAETRGLRKQEESLARNIIQNLDEHGFHREPPELLFFPTQTNGHSGTETASMHDASAQGAPAQPQSRDASPCLTSAQRAMLCKMLSLVQSFDPVGTACADSQESLLVQARQYDAPDAAVELLQHHFALLQKPRVPLLQKALPHYSADALQRALDFIRALDPLPARAFAAHPTQYAVPDVYVYTNETDSADFADRFTIVLADESLPVPAISPLFKELSAQGEGAAHDKATKSFVQAHINDAEGFLQSLDLRKKTILRVTAEVVRRQKAFFLGASDVPAPLLMKDVAKALDVHLATVSRAVNNKYVQCSRGLFELRSFFSESLGAAQSRAQKVEESIKNGAHIENPASKTANTVTKEAVKQKIRELILQNAQSGGKPLSDSKLTTLLEQQGMGVARRTVAKYRAELGLASSFDRPR